MIVNVSLPVNLITYPVAILNELQSPIAGEETYPVEFFERNAIQCHRLRFDWLPDLFPKRSAGSVALRRSKNVQP